MRGREGSREVGREKKSQVNMKSIRVKLKRKRAGYGKQKNEIQESDMRMSVATGGARGTHFGAF